MAINNGPFNFSGSFGNIRFYYDPVLKLHIASGKAIGNSDAFWNNPNKARCWDLVREFGGRSKWAALVKKSLSDIEHLMFQRCFNQIQTSGYLIQQQDETGINGLRGVVVKNDPAVLLDINLNERNPFSRVLRGNYEVNLSPDKKTITLTIPGFIPSKHAHWKTNYYAVRFYLVIFQISDMVWNPVNKKYEPVVSDLELLSQCTVSEWMFRNGIPVDVILQASLEQAALTRQGTSLAAALGVEFSTSAFRGQPNVKPESGSAAIIAYYTI
jgi:hypothetical protein